MDSPIECYICGEELNVHPSDPDGMADWCSDCDEEE